MPKPMDTSSSDDSKTTYSKAQKAKPRAQTKGAIIWFLDVGLGDGTLIRTPDHKAILVDFGSSKFKPIEKDILGFLEARRLKDFKETSSFRKEKEVELLVLTHPDRDHYNLIPKLLDKKFKFSTVWYSGKPRDYSVKAVADFFEKKIKEKCAGVPQVWKVKKFEGLDLTVLACNSAGKAKVKDATNTNSIVLQFSFNNTTVILPGDATMLTESAILRAADVCGFNLKSNILKLAHHGSARTSTSAEWIKTVSPEWVFVSAERTGKRAGAEEKGTHYGLPQQAAIDTALQWATSLQESEAPLHRYVACLDASTSSNFGKSRSCNRGVEETLHHFTFKNTKQPPWNTYYEIATKRRIFTSICGLDRKGKGSEAADVGTSYEVLLEAKKPLAVSAYEPDLWVEKQEERAFSALGSGDRYRALKAPKGKAEATDSRDKAPAAIPMDTS